MSIKSKLAAVPIAFLVAHLSFAQTVNVTLRETRFTVMNHSGEFVRDLNRGDFVVYDNDVRQEATEFDRKLQAPLSLAVLIDRSQSMGDRFQFVSSAASAFVKAVVREQDDEGLIVAFDSKVYLLQDWTPSVNALVDTIRKLTPAGGTSMFDALYKTVRDKFDSGGEGQKVAVLVTDGEDTTSRATLDDALRMAKLSGVAVYVVGIRAEGSLNTRELQGRHVLADLSAMTGGRVFYPATGREEQLTDLFASLQDELRNGYSIGYYVDAPLDNSFHRLRIEPKDKSLTVHAPKGYYARKL